RFSLQPLYRRTLDLARHPSYKSQHERENVTVCVHPFVLSYVEGLLKCFQQPAKSRASAAGNRLRVTDPLPLHHRLAFKVWSAARRSPPVPSAETCRTGSTAQRDIRRGQADPDRA